MYEVILIDADGTLFDYDKAEEYSLIKSYKQFEVKEDFSKISARYKEINSSLWKDLEEGKITAYDLRTERFRKLFAEFEQNISIEAFSKVYLKNLGDSSFLIEGAEEVCRYMANKYKVYIVTNGIKEIQIARLENSSIKDYICGMIISEEVGVSKPNPYIFEYALQKAKITKKENVIMIGDSLTADIKGGIEYGIDTCWVNIKNVDVTTGNIKPKYEVIKLIDLFKII